ncbi:hypothetical protein BD410DRAFT_794722, partial [Rickenella mellea]
MSLQSTPEDPKYYMYVVIPRPGHQHVKLYIDDGTPHSDNITSCCEREFVGPTCTIKLAEVVDMETTRFLINHFPQMCGECISDFFEHFFQEIEVVKCCTEEEWTRIVASYKSLPEIDYHTTVIPPLSPGERLRELDCQCHRTKIIRMNCL